MTQDIGKHQHCTAEIHRNGMVHFAKFCGEPQTTPCPCADCYIECASVEHDAAVVEAAATWLANIRHQTWNGGERRPSNYGRAAHDLRVYAEALRGGVQL